MDYNSIQFKNRIEFEFEFEFTFNGENKKINKK